MNQDESLANVSHDNIHGLKLGFYDQKLNIFYSLAHLTQEQLNELVTILSNPNPVAKNP